MPTTILTDRSLIRLSGEDVRGFLNGLVTSDVAGALPVWAGLLTPQGKCLFDFIVWADGEDLLLDCEAGAADDLVKRLKLYRLRRAITIERDETLAVCWSADGEEGVPDPRFPALGRRWIESCAPAKAGVQSGEAASAPRESGPMIGRHRPPDGDLVRSSSQGNKWLEHRLRLGVCEGRAELGDLLWLECNAAELNGVSFSKGCFVGQENTARMNWRQKVNRRLFVVAGEGGQRARIAFPDLGLAVVHARTDAVPDGAILPDWLQITA